MGMFCRTQEGGSIRGGSRLSRIAFLEDLTRLHQARTVDISGLNLQRGLDLTAYMFQKTASKAAPMIPIGSIIMAKVGPNTTTLKETQSPPNRRIRAIHQIQIHRTFLIDCFESRFR